MDIQTASVEDLAELPKIGNARAKKIQAAQRAGPISVRVLVDSTGLPAEHFGELMRTNAIKDIPLEIEPHTNPMNTTSGGNTMMEQLMMQMIASIKDLKESIVSQQNTGSGPEINQPTDGMMAYAAEKGMQPKQDFGTKTTSDDATKKFMESVLQCYPENSKYEGKKKESMPSTKGKSQGDAHAHAHHQGRDSRKNREVTEGRPEKKKGQRKGMKIKEEIRESSNEGRRYKEPEKTKQKQSKKSSRKKNRRYSSTSSSASSSSDSEDEMPPDTASSSASDSDEEARHPRRDYRNDRRRSPPPPKMDTFHGNSEDWNSFLFQFRQVCKSCKWSDRTKRDKLMACLRGKAIDYVSKRPSSVRKDYHKLLKDLKKRYGKTDTSSASRKELQSLRQEETETVEEFADKTYAMTLEAFPKAAGSLIQTLAVDTFLRGCRERQAALMTMERRPKTISKAIKYLKNSIQNCRALAVSSRTARQVTFEEDTPSVRSVTPETSEKTLEHLVKTLISTVEKVSNTRSRQSPERGCYKCGQQGHLAHECQSDRKHRSEESRQRSASPNDACRKCGKRGHYARECWSNQNRSQSRSLSPAARDRRCFKCQGSGHIARDCPNGGQERNASPSRKPASNY